MSERFIPLIRPVFDEEEYAAVRRVLESGRLVQGPQVEAFEQSICDYTGSRFGVAVTNCTAALQLALLALGLRPGDRVLVAAFSWISTANVVVLCGAMPIFVDIDPRTFNLSPLSLLKILEHMPAAERHKVKAILPVHAFGQMADMEAIMEIADRFQLPVIEDAACALGATFSGRQAGTWGTMGCFSFHPRKAITTGEGGMIITSDERLARRLRKLRNHGMRVGQKGIDFSCPGFNYRMTEFQAALGRVQMKKLSAIVQARRHLAQAYSNELTHSDYGVPWCDPRAESVFQSYVIKLPDHLASRRTQLICDLKQKGIETTIGTYCMPSTRWFRRKLAFRAGQYPAAEEAYYKLLTLPLYDRMEPRDQKMVVEALRDAG